jgi:hypothetical protein
LDSNNIGRAVAGGFFAGLISHTADGIATHALIVAPAATGATGTNYTITTMLAWKNATTATSGTTSPFDGAANTANMSGGAHAAADFCTGLTIGGYSDWYLPARYELDIAYENLKPTTDTNNTSWGINDYSVPKRTANRTESIPGRTSIAAFQSGGGQAFINAAHWSSTEATATNAWTLNFTKGEQTSTSKTTTRRVRAFRRIAL